MQGYFGKIEKKSVLCLTAIFFLFSMQAVFGQSKDIPNSMVRFAESELMEFAASREIVESVREQNSEALSIEEIKALDERWMAYDGINRFMMDRISNNCALALWNFQLDHRYVLEIFVMDNQGANVGQTGKTSDFWQGDEAKFKESYKNGTGSIHYGDPEYDESVDELIAQISVPVMSGGRAIGAVTFGISLDGWERR
jgi:hypothetical protein